MADTLKRRQPASPLAVVPWVTWAGIILSLGCFVASLVGKLT